MAHTANILKELKQCLQNEKVAATYACGGSVPIVSPSPIRAGHTSDRAEDISTEPITLRWDHNYTEGSTSVQTQSKLTLPSDGSAALQTLLDDMQVAGFGLHGKDVVDETYRKASKMDTTQFCTNFSPYDVGICEAITQLLMPNIKGSRSVRGIRAELYKLNVYSGLSGKFEAHVDTPRSPLQFGSLIVCLPSTYEGGQLLVDHAGQTQTFDWSSSVNDGRAHAINWAAFYSDCAHQVLPVTSGHRLTLTYNLYLSPDPSSWNERHPIAAPTLPLYAVVSNILRDPLFMPKGGTLGIPCCHAYAHTTGKKLHGLPAALKGADLAAVEVFVALGLQIRLRPILSDAGQEIELFHDEMDAEMELEPAQAYAVHGRMLRDAAAKGGEPDSIMTAVGTDMHELNVCGEEIEMEGVPQLLETGAWPHELEKVTWLESEKVHSQTALAYLAYGNQAEMGTQYSYAALLVTIPPSDQRVVAQPGYEQCVGGQ